MPAARTVPLAVALLIACPVIGYSTTSLDVDDDSPGIDAIGNASNQSFASETSVKTKLRGAAANLPRRFSYGWSSTMQLPTPPRESTSAKNMTLCVPLIPRDSTIFQTRFVEDLNAQTVKPSELVVAASGVSNEDALKLEASLRKLVRGIPVFVTSVEHSALPGENRNRCVKHSHGEVITFFDSDDSMHPRRTEILQYIFDMFHPKVILHPFFGTGASRNELIETFPCVSASTSTWEYQNTFANKIDGTVAQGWATVSRDVFDRVHYNEAKAAAEDTDFLRDVMRSYGYGPTASTMVAVGLQLGTYTARLERELGKEAYSAKVSEQERTMSPMPIADNSLEAVMDRRRQELSKIKAVKQRQKSAQAAQRDREESRRRAAEPGPRPWAKLEAIRHLYGH